MSTPKPVDKYFVDVKEAAWRLSVSPRHVHDLIDNNLLPACRSGLAPAPEEGKRDTRKKLIHVKDLEAYAEHIRDNRAA